MLILKIDHADAFVASTVMSFELGRDGQFGGVAEHVFTTLFFSVVPALYKTIKLTKFILNHYLHFCCSTQ